MTQDGSSRSTGTELSEAQKGQLEDADTLVSDKICELLNNAMRTDEELIRVDAVPPTHGEFSPDTRDLLRRVWTIAAQFQHREVVADHLITGMVTGDESIGAPSPNKFSEAGIDLAALRSRTFARLAGLSTPTALDDLPVPTQPVAPDVVRWISGAVRIAQARDEYGREVSPDDLVQVVLNARQPGHPLHELLQDVTDRFDPGKQLAPAALSPLSSPPGILVQVESAEDAQPSAEVRIVKAIQSAHKTASYARTELRRIKDTQLADLAEAVGECRNQLSDLDRRTVEIRNTQLTGLAQAVGDCREQLAALHHQAAAIREDLSVIGGQTVDISDNRLARLAEAVGDCRRQTVAIMAGLPRPPATGWVALAIVIVLVLGSAAGIALRHPSLPAAVEKLLKS